MAIYEKRGVVAGRVEDVFHQPPEAEQELLCTYLDDSESIAVHSNMLTIVLNRDIRKSVDISAAMAVHLAKKYPSRNILLLNTYAGTALMQQSLRAASRRAATRFRRPTRRSWGGTMRTRSSKARAFRSRRICASFPVRRGRSKRGGSKKR